MSRTRTYILGVGGICLGMALTLAGWLSPLQKVQHRVRRGQHATRYEER